MVKAYSYIRFSTKRQADGDSLRRQTKLATDYAKKHQLSLQDLTLHDLGVSAFKGANQQTALGSFLSLVDSGAVPKGSYLLVESFDRLSREAVEDAISLFLEIIRKGITVVTLSDNRVYRKGQLDMTDLIIGITIMSRANNESEEKSKRVKAIWSDRKDQARTSGSIIVNSNYPRWLKRDGDKLTPIPEHVEVLQKVYEYSRNGMGYSKIAQLLNDQGYATFQRGKPFRAGYINSLLRNRAVLGEYQPHIIINGTRTPDGEPIPNYYPQVITADTFIAAQNAIDKRNQRGAGYRKGTFTNLFMGLLSCECGASIILGSQNRNGSSYLKCPNLSCSGTIRYQYAEDQILVAVSHLSSIIRHYAAPDDKHLSELELAIQSTQSRLQTVTELLSAHPSATLAKQVSELETVLQSHQQDYQKQKQKIDAARSRRQITLLNKEPKQTREQRAAINAKLRQLIDGITVHDMSQLVYMVEGKPVLEQHFKQLYRASESRIYEIADGQPELVAMTTSKGNQTILPYPA